MTDEQASQERLAALTRAAGHAEGPDPEFWGTEPRPVRRAPRSDRAADAGPLGPAWWSALVDRVRDLRLELGIGIVVVAMVAVVAGLVWYRMGVAGGSGAPASSTSAGQPTAMSAAQGPSGAARATTTPATTDRDAGASGATRRGPTVVVHVAGAVARPGVLVMPAGARVIDAVEGAGGGLPDADLDRVNLAAELVDGQRILVVKVGATPAVGSGPTDGIPDSGALIDLNNATSAQLEELPGIGPALAGAILAERERRGGFRSVNELREVRGIGDARFADLRDRVTV